MKKKEETLEERLLRFTRKGSGCWEWLGGKNRLGYGRLEYRRVKYLAPRAAWLVWRGEIKRGLCVLHKCDNPACVNQRHLWLGTNFDNQQDSVAKGRHYRASLTRCPRGHVLSGENLYSGTQDGGRHKVRGCRACKRIHGRKHDRFRRALRLAERLA